jgi:hypothetical protein
LKEALHGSKGLVVLIVLLLVFPTIARQSFSTRLQDSPEYRRHVHNHLRFGGGVNATYVEKPVFPVLMNESQIPIGQNWSIVCPLRANHGYHVYCYGEWVNNGSEPKTDYDIYVYNPLGEMEGYHTESAGLPEHLGTTVNEPFFKPRLSGNYTFVVRNDPRESKHAQKATFMMIENVKCNAWHEHYVEGKDASSSPVFNTSWAYEFWTESQHVEIWIKVPESLDMYEARVYLMGNPLSKMGQILNEVPLAWEPGLYGNSSNKCGGYNLESKEDRGLAYTSCEFFGQDMFLNFTSPYRGKSLYHLVLIGETGSGTVEFLVKTEFDKACLRPSTIPSRVYPHNGTAITYFSNSTDLTNATLQYSIDGWQNTTTLRMDIVNNRTCWATIPEQNAGTVVSYVVEAKDIFENLLKAGGSFPVKHQLTLTISLPRKAVTIGENMTVRGYVTPAGDELPIVLTFTSTNQSKQIECSTFENGTFIASFRPETLGAWSIQATFGEDRFRYGSTSAQLVARVDEPSLIAKYSLYIGGGLGTLAVVSAIVYVKKKTE